MKDGKKIKLMRKAMGMTAMELSIKMGLHHGAVSTWESGSGASKNIHRIEAVFNKWRQDKINALKAEIIFLKKYIKHIEDLDPGKESKIDDSVKAVIELAKKHNTTILFHYVSFGIDYELQVTPDTESSKALINFMLELREKK